MQPDNYDWAYASLLPDGLLAILIIGACVWAMVALVFLMARTNGRR